jgi:hypothetical protein
VPAQRQLALASRRLPDFDRPVPASAGNLLTIWTEANTRDKAVKCSIVSTHHTFKNKQEYETAVTYLECPFRVDWHSRVLSEPTDHILTVSSQLPVASLLPSLFHATDVTRLECPYSVHLQSKVPAEPTAASFAFTLASAATSAATFVLAAACEMPPQVKVRYPTVCLCTRFS